MRKIGMFLLNSLLKVLKPIQIFMQSLGRAEPKMSRESVDLAMSLIKTGDILLSYEKQRFTSLFIPGKYKHAAIMSPSGVIEAVGDKFVDGKNIGGVRKVDLEEWLFLMDNVAVVRPMMNQEINYIAGCNALSYVGLGYDYEFKLDKSAIYCSELVYLCYASEGDLFKGLEKIKIPPQKFRNMCDDVKLKLVFEFK